MKINVTKTTYICELNENIQASILRDLYRGLTSEGLYMEEINECINIALAGRLCDIEDTIDISKYLTC